MPAVIALYKIVCLCTRIVLPPCIWSLSTQSDLVFFLVMYVNEPLKLACIALVKKIKARPFCSFVQYWWKQRSASVLVSCKIHFIQVSFIFISCHLFCSEKEKWVTFHAILAPVVEQNETALYTTFYYQVWVV